MLTELKDCDLKSLLSNVVCVFSLLIVFVFTGCGERPCAERAGEERDWCYHEEAARLAGEGDLQGMWQSLQAIEAEAVRAAAVDRVMTATGGKLSMPQIHDLCATLSAAEQAACFRSWSRPHLWLE